MMSAVGIGSALVWLAVALLLGLVLVRRARGAWALEDEAVSPPSIRQKAVVALAALVAAVGTVLFLSAYF